MIKIVNMICSEINLGDNEEDEETNDKKFCDSS